MNSDLLLETEKLTRSWEQHEASWLRDYLVAGVEDPRLNVQSILSRHFLIRALAADRWQALMSQEYRFAAVMNWLLGAAGKAEDSDTPAAILHALKRRSDNAEGLEIPTYVLQTFAALPAQADGLRVPNYIEDLLVRRQHSPHPANITEEVLNTFSTVWNTALATGFPLQEVEQGSAIASEGPSNEAPPPLSLIEPACGSANDYRFLHSYGIARLFKYTGFDLCQKNVENASALFPGVHFERGNVFEISAPAKTFDLCVVHDLFEHLSLEGLERAVREVCRVTRRGICAGFFQMDEIAEHIVRPRDEYYWNLLSLARVRAQFAQEGFCGQAIHISTFLAHHTGCEQTHNPNAYTLILHAGGDSDAAPVRLKPVE